jgi:hypothetical protein
MLGIDFGPGIATGIEIDGSTPPWSRSSRLPDGGLHAEFDLPIADGGGIELEFAARATRAGTFSDQIHSRFDDEHWSGVLPASFAVDP